MWITLFIMSFIGFIFVFNEFKNPVDVDCKSELF